MSTLSNRADPEYQAMQRSARSRKAAVTQKRNKALAKAGAITVKATRVADPVLDAVLAVTTGAGLEAVSTALGRVQQMAERLADYRKMLKLAMVDYIDAHGGEVTIGEVRYWTGDKPKTTCNDQREVLLELLEVVGPDGAAGFLSSNAFKHGSIKKTFPGVFERHFTVTYEREVRDNEKPDDRKARRLQTSRPRGDLPGESPDADYATT